MLKKAKGRIFLLPVLIMLLGSAIAFSVFLLSDYTDVKTASAGNSPQWAEEIGLGASFPACSSATPNLSCVAEAPLVNLTGNYDGGHGTCSWANISITGGPSWASQPCTSWSVNWGGAASNATYSYDVEYWYDAPLITVCDAWGEFGCVSSHDEDPPPTIIDQYLGSFTTPNCTPLTATCSVSLTTANIGQNVTWTALALGGAPTVKQGQDITPDTNAGWTDVYNSTLFARRFQANGSYQLQRAAFYLAREGTVDGTLWVTLESDGGANPSGTVLATSNSRDAESLCVWGACGNWIAFSFDNYRLTSGTNYWLVLRGSSMVGPTNKILPWANTGGDPAWDSRVRSFLIPSVWSAPDQSIAFLVYGPSYTYTWSGDEGLSGITRTVVKSYSTASPPPKTGAVTVNDGTRSAGPFACSNTVTVNPPPEPDLVIQSPAFSPGSPIVSQSVTFSGTVANTGTGAAGASQARVRVDLNNDGWSVGEPEFTNPTGALGVGGTEAESFAPWTSVLGTHSYQICADSGSTVAESDEGNNCSVPQAFTVSNPPPQANLTIDPHSATPSSVVVGTNVTIQGTVRNQGGAGAGQSNTRLRVDIGSDGSWDTTQNAATGALASAGSELEQWILIVGSVGPRTYEICADSAGAVPESNEADNCVTGTYSGVNPPADLIIQSPSMNPGSPLVNQTVTFSGTVRNQGSTDAGSSQTRLLIDVSPSGAGPEDVSSDNPTGALAASVGTEIESYTWTAVFGNHTYQICADATNVVSESNEGNNCTALIPFSVGLPVLSISLSASPPSPGIAPFSTTLTAEITSYTGSPSDTINYSFWWNCSQTTTNVGIAEAACGTLPAPSLGNCVENSVGYKCNAVNSTSRSVPHTYTTPTGSPFSPKVIIERNGALPKEARIPITVSWPAIGGACAVPPSADVGDSVTWSASGTGGDGNYTYEWYSMTGSPSPATCAGQPSLACRNFPTSYGAPGTKSGNVRIRSAGLTPYETACSNSVTISGKIISFGGTPPVIFSGGTATLSWVTSGYSNGQCSIDNGIGVANPAASGSVPTPVLTANTEYTLTCNDGTGDESLKTTIIVGSPPTFEEIAP